MKLVKVFNVANIPFIVHFHGHDASVVEKIKKHDNYQALFKAAHFVVAVSKVMERKLKELGCPVNKLVLNTYGPNNAFLQLQASCKEESLVSIGRFVDKKAPYYTILAFSEALKECPNAVLYMAGNGILQDTCQNLAKYLGIDKQVKILGVIETEKYQEILTRTRGFVQHSITATNGDMEGTPLAVLEASAAGVPVISTFHAGISDVVIHEKTGLLVEEHDVKGMAQNMVRVLKDQQFAYEMGAGSQKPY